MYSQRLDATSFDFCYFDEIDLDRAILGTNKEDQEGAEGDCRGVCYKLGYRGKHTLMRDLKQLLGVGQQPSPLRLDGEHTQTRRAHGEGSSHLPTLGRH